MIADEIKLVLVKWLLEKLEQPEALASELQFASGSSRADLVISSPRRLCAIEVKGPRDDFRRLNRQQAAYQKAFLESFLAVTPRHFTTAIQTLDQRVGIIVVDGERARIVRRAAKLRTLPKEASVQWLLASELNRITSSIAPRRATKQQMEEIALANFSQRELTKNALNSIYARVSPKYKAFLRERGRTLNSDDIKTLSIPRRIG